MNSADLASGVRGRTIRFSWTDGPTKGTTHEHVFYEDGTVEWYSCDERGARQKPDERRAERPTFSDEEIMRGIRLVSYLSNSGYTLTVVLNANDGRIAGVASNEKTWVPVHGSFKVLD